MVRLNDWQKTEIGQKPEPGIARKINFSRFRNFFETRSQEARSSGRCIASRAPALAKHHADTIKGHNQNRVKETYHEDFR